MTADKRESAKQLCESGVSIRHACEVVGLSRASFYRQPRDWRRANSAVIDALNAQVRKSPQAGFWKYYDRIRQQGYDFNHKRVYRVYCQMELNKPRRIKRVLPKRTPKPLSVMSQPNHQWALDFIHDSLYCGKRFRALNIIDEGTQECLAIEVDSSLPAAHVIRILEQLKEERGLPEQLRMDNGPEFISTVLVDWCEENRIEMAYIAPGKPQQNGFIERFIGSFRREFLDAYLFETLTQVRDMAWGWMLDYNEERLHDSLGKLPPVVYRQKLENSNVEVFH